MANDDLKQTLMTLHAQLASGAQIDPELQDLLRLLDADIRNRVSQTNAAGRFGAADPAGPLGSTDPASVTGMADADAVTLPPRGLGARAQEISARFAAAHPQLEPVLRELTDTLQRIGI